MVKLLRDLYTAAPRQPYYYAPNPCYSQPMFSPLSDPAKTLHKEKFDSAAKHFWICKLRSKQNVHMSVNEFNLIESLTIYKITTTIMHKSFMYKMY